MGGLRSMPAFAAISGALVIHARIWSGVSFEPTSSRAAPFLLPSPAIWWHTWHLESVNGCLPRAAASFAKALGASRLAATNTSAHFIWRISCAAEHQQACPRVRLGEVLRISGV